MPATIRVTPLGGDRFEIGMRQHRVRVDQPVSDGGDDTGPTPTELFVASLAGCVAFYTRRYLARHDLPTEGLVVEATYAMASRPARVAEIEVRLELPPAVPEANRAALLAVASHCTVHNTLRDPPAVHIDVVGPSSAAA